MNMNNSIKSIGWFNEIKLSLIATVFLLLLVSGVYPVVIWGVSHLVFAHKAGGSLIENDHGAVIGSSLLGQSFTSAKYFHSRPSKAGSGYDATSSGGSNYGQTTQSLMDTIKARAISYRAENGLDSNAILPADAVTASASGLDPDISLDNALMQVQRVAKARGVGADYVEQVVRGKLKGRDLGVFGEPRVNVLLLNLALDQEGK